MVIRASAEGLRRKVKKFCMYISYDLSLFLTIILFNKQRLIKKEISPYKPNQKRIREEVNGRDGMGACTTDTPLPPNRRRVHYLRQP
ncbi:hypothetical protein RIF29_12787 [Crotalaria pallida]|uniref:Uncharacterized protein n=1 Tax=Crotalaria pallida TaxID=3830 RepID=A0AAN9P1I9_CROPI